jgi:hypothetical protein
MAVAELRFVAAMVFMLSSAEQSEGETEIVDRDGEGALVLLHFGSMARTRGGVRGKGRERELGMDVHASISSNACREAKWARWELVLGQLRADFGPGPRSKVGAHSMLYNFD